MKNDQDNPDRISAFYIAQGGYELNAYLEYCLKGPFKPGADNLYTKGFAASLDRLNR